MVRMVFFLKPDAVVRRYAGARTLKELLKLGGMKFLFFGFVQAEEDFLAEIHYKEHKGKHFHPWLVEYNLITPLGVVLIDTDEDGVRRVREWLGPTLVQRAFREAPGTIRGRYGVYGGANVAHASDSPENGELEFRNWSRFLQSRGLRLGVREEEVVARMEEYIDRYIEFPMIDVATYVELGDTLKANPEMREEILEKMVDLLNKETDEGGYVRKLAEGIVANILL